MRYKCTLAIATAAITLATPVVSSAKDTRLHAPPNETLSGGPISSPDRNAFRGDSRIDTDAQIIAEDGSVEANFELSFALAGEPTRQIEDNIAYLNGSFWAGAIKASLPLGEGSRPDVDFKNFGVDGSLTLSLNHYSPHFASSESLDPLQRTMAARCAHYAGSAWISENVPLGDQNRALKGSLESFVAQYEDRMKNHRQSWDDFLIPWKDYKTEFANDAKFQPTDAFKDVYNAIVSKCKAGSESSPIGNTRDIIFYFRDNFPDDPAFIAYRKTVTPDRATFFGIEGSMGLSRFNLLDSTNFQIVDDDRVGFDFNAHYGWIFDNADTAVRLGGGYARTYEAQDKVEFCRIVGTGTDQECIEGQDGAPSHEDTAYVEVGLRHVLDRDRNGSPKIAISPSATYIFEDDAFQFEFPLYLQRSKENGLDAGIKATYNTGEKDVAFGVFVGVPFNLVTR